MAIDHTVTKGTTWRFDVTVSYPQGQLASPPYTYTLLKDNLPQAGYTNIQFTGNTTLFSYTFNEIASATPYLFGVYIKDSCGTGIQSNTDMSNITVVDIACQPPSCGFTMTQIIWK